ncbi:MAG: CDP-alcohol phosphatidyltransferase family protein [Candidatus Competibacteraceae bacterium]|nr:CDP-alcohol phosphatidyltransferase family protein [Candidatus Competibacteraceae bacterium]
MKPRDIPNLITAARILLVPPILWLLLQERYSTVLLLFLLAGASDGLDGYLAKRFGWSTYLGSILDPLADKLLLMGAIVVLGWQGNLPVWLVVLVILRDVVIVSGALSYHYLIESFEASPLLISKLNTVVQILLVLAILFDQGVRALPEPILVGLLASAALTTVSSGGIYVWEWGRRALSKGKQANAP